MRRDRSAKTRLRRLKRSPLCVTCLAAGVTKATEEVDHIIPLAWAGQPVDEAGAALLVDLGLFEPGAVPTRYPLNLDVDKNTQGLCTYHNRMKRNAEVYGHRNYGLDGWPE